MQARFLLSAASAADFPKTGFPEIAMVGRSNVGKSSLINALVKQKIARTSAAPGKTRLANYYLIDSRLYLVDLPGYGYARGGPESAEAFEQLTQQYFDMSDPRRHVAGVLHVIDARHPDLHQDAVAYDWLQRTGHRIAVVATKIDKIGRAERTRTLAALAKKYDAPILPESVLDGTGVKEIWALLLEWVIRL